MMICDMCKKQFKKELNFLFLYNDRTMLKKADLCEECAYKLIRYVEDYKLEEGIE